MEKNNEKENKLKLIPKAEIYCTYIINLIIKLPRTEKFSIGKEYKKSLYEMLNQIMYLNKIGKNNKENILNILNKIDAELMTQRIFLRIMKNNKWIDNKKFKVAMELIYEIGKILGGLIKYYAKNNKEYIQKKY